MNFVSELKRRRVFKVGAAYVVVAWLAIQAVSIGFPAFDAPPWALRIFILVSLLGFPLAVVMAWVFDLTPQGVKLDPDVGGGKRVYAIAVVLVVLALGWYFYGQPSFRKGDAPTPVSRAATDPDTIAVLPFDNMSGDPKQDYFSDGMTEELLNVLAKVPRLKVVARTSVFQFKGKGGDVRDIGRKLGVSHIVEGSVRRDGDAVRITAQLVRVSDGFHVWSETYDRKLEGVFALQDDIARKISAQLTQSLGVAPIVTARAPIDPAAYDDYLKGRALMRQRKDLPTAIEHLQAAVAKAPNFAEGWSSLSVAQEVIYWYVPMDKAQATDWLAHSAQSATRAEALAADSAATQHVLGNVARDHFDYAAAEQHYLRGIEIDPSYPDVREDYSELLYLVGRLQDSAAATEQLVQLDPYYIVGWMRRLDAVAALDDRAEVQHAITRLRELDSNNGYGIFGDLDYAMAFSREDEMRKAAVQLEANHPPEGALVNVLLPWVLHDAQAKAQAAQAAIWKIPAMDVANYLVARKDVEGYLGQMDRVGPLDLTYYFVKMYVSKPTGQAMLRDPRIKTRLVDYGFERYWREKGWPAGCRALGETDFECGLDAAKAH